MCYSNKLSQISLHCSGILLQWAAKAMWKSILIIKVDVLTIYICIIVTGIILYENCEAYHQ